MLLDCMLIFVDKEPTTQGLSHLSQLMQLNGVELRHMENTSYCEGKNKVWIWIVHSLETISTSQDGVWTSHSSKGKFHSYPPRPASTGQKETVLKQWWPIWNNGPITVPLCLETSVTASPLLVGLCPSMSFLARQSPLTIRLSCLTVPFSHSRHSGHPTLLPLLWACQDLPASKSWLVGKAPSLI